MEYRLIVDSCCELIDELREKLGAERVPLSMYVDGKEFVDNENLDVQTFIKAMVESKNIVKSSCPSPEAFVEKFRKAGHIFAVTLSSKLSATYNSAVVAKGIVEGEDPSKKIHVFDSLSATAGELLIGLKILECVEKNLSWEKIINTVDGFIKEMKTFFVLESLENLIKAGRMSRVKAQLAYALSIRPIMGADDEGNIKLYKKIRGSKKALSNMVDMISDYGQDIANKTLIITYCNCLDKAEYVKTLIKEKYNFKAIHMVPCGGLSSLYANEGGVVIAYS